MAASYLGPETIGGTVVGLSSAFSTVGVALANLKAVCDVQFGLIGSASASITAQADACLAAQIAIRIPAVGELQASLDASLAMGAQLSASISDPSAYLTALLAGLASVEASLGLSLPVVQLGLQVDANLAISAGLGLKIGAIDLQLEALVSINVALTVVVQALLSIQGALSAAISAVLSALSLYASMTLTLAVPGAYLFLYTGTLSGTGAGFDAVSSLTGLPGSTVVRVPIIVVDTSDTAAVASLNAVFKTS